MRQLARSPQFAKVLLSLQPTWREHLWRHTKQMQLTPRHGVRPAETTRLLAHTRSTVVSAPRLEHRPPPWGRGSGLVRERRGLWVGRGAVPGRITFRADFRVAGVGGPLGLGAVPLCSVCVCCAAWPQRVSSAAQKRGCHTSGGLAKKSAIRDWAMRVKSGSGCCRRWLEFCWA